MSGQASSYFNPGQAFREVQPEHPHQDVQEPKQLCPPQYVPNDKPPQYGEVFKIEKPKYHDAWAGVLFMATFCGFVGVSGIAIHKYARFKGFNGGGIYDSANGFSLDTNALVLFVLVLCVALAFSWAYLLGARYFTKLFIWVTGILNIVFALATGIYYIARGQYGGGVVFLVFGVFAIICFISWIPRIPFSALMLQTAMDVARDHGHVFLVSALGGITAVAFSAWFSVTLVAIYVAYEPSGGGVNPACANGGCSRSTVIGLIVYVTFAMYWFSEWLKNTIHTTIAGVYGAWYFWSRLPGGLPKGSTRGALIIAIIDMLRQALSVVQRQQLEEGNVVGCIAASILGRLVAFLDWLVTFINRYAFCHIALYGKAYIPAAKDTWTMMKDRGVDALVNDCLIGPVLTMGFVFVAYLCALLSYLYLQFTRPAYNSTGDFTAVIMAFAFLIGLQICRIFLTPIGSGVDTIFVAMGWDPQVMIIDHPHLYKQIVHVYPQVQEAILA
ncbi:hypothetical protein VTN02DRAFT_338 [Thermoascus thermophilus]